MTQHFPTEDDLSRIEAILAQQVRVGERLAEELRVVVEDALRDKLVPIKESVEGAEGVASDARAAGGHWRDPGIREAQR